MTKLIVNGNTMNHDFKYGNNILLDDFFFGETQTKKIWGSKEELIGNRKKRSKMLSEANVIRSS